MDYAKISDYASKLSLAAVLLGILYFGSTGYWVFGSQYRDVVADRDTWKELALKGTKVAEQAAVRMTGPSKTSPPLPSNPSSADVKARLDSIDVRTHYLTEPTDKPLP